MVARDGIDPSHADFQPLAVSGNSNYINELVGTSVVDLRHDAGLGRADSRKTHAQPAGNGRPTGKVGWLDPRHCPEP
jgi:hypothetical protein